MRLFKQLLQITSILIVTWIPSTAGQNQRYNCYSDDGSPQRCVSEFVNAAFGRTIVVSNTCGLGGPTEFCSPLNRGCETCDGSDPSKSHPAEHMTDSDIRGTWWQSETLSEGMQYPNSVNLTLNLGKSYKVTYVTLRFTSFIPESFAIYKRTSQDGPWLPYQYYSSSCEQTYGIPNNEVITRAEETKAICTEKYSDITAGSVPFSTLEGRPSALSFDSSPVLQEWVTATDIMITLNRMNTFGDEVFGGPAVGKSYYYAISDFAVGARCVCNGHGNSCSARNDTDGAPVCQCEHNTAGPDCGECAPGFHDAPWGRATASDARECKACDCNGKSKRCYFDHEMYEKTGSGGHCIDCQDNTAGPHCELCKENHYGRTAQDRCEACQCNEKGSESQQCGIDGRCRCKVGVGGDKCDRCLPNYYGHSQSGCRKCQCSEAGILNNKSMCAQDTGKCICKANVEGQKCDRFSSGVSRASTTFKKQTHLVVLLASTTTTMALLIFDVIYSSTGTGGISNGVGWRD